MYPSNVGLVVAAIRSSCPAGEPNLPCRTDHSGFGQFWGSLNGAGKSTTMRLLTAQSIADEGEIEVLGFRLPAESKEARAQCGVSPQLDNLDTTLTVQQNLLVFAHLYRIARAERGEAIERALKMANLVDRRDSRVDKLSGGMRRRLLIARALIHQPRL